MAPRGLVAFDLDGTLFRGPTACELLAAPLGRLADMQRFEALSSEADITSARIEMARWYAELTPARLDAALAAATWAPGAREAVHLLQASGVEVVIASITWRFAAEWAARQLGLTRVLGTGLGTGFGQDHQVHDVWPRDKGPWLRRVTAELGLPRSRVAAVGDSASDVHLMSEADLAYFVGERPPPRLPGLRHHPAGDLHAIARDVLTAWGGSCA